MNRNTNIWLGRLLTVSARDHPQTTARRNWTRELIMFTGTTKLGVLVIIYIWYTTEYTERQRPLSSVHSIIIEKLVQAGEGYLPSRTKLCCTLRLRGQIHSPYFLLHPDMYSVWYSIYRRIISLLPHQGYYLCSWFSLKRLCILEYKLCMPVPKF